MDTELFFSQIANGIANGVVYASVALALVLIYRSTGLLNFAQGEMALFSTYVAWKFSTTDMPVVVAILLAMALSFIAGAVIERVLIRPVEQARSPLNVVIVTLGMFLALNALAQLFFGTDPQQMPSAFPSGRVDLGVTEVGKDVIGLAVVLIIESLLIYLLLQRTKLGLMLRAVASNSESARLVGINSGLMLMFGWALAAALGGFDSPLGAIIAGLVVGIADALTIQYVDFLDGIEVALPLVLILGVLLVRPTGLFGRRTVERV